MYGRSAVRPCVTLGVTLCHASQMTKKKISWVAISYVFGGFSHALSSFSIFFSFNSLSTFIIWKYAHYHAVTLACHAAILPCHSDFSSPSVANDLRRLTCMIVFIQPTSIFPMFYVVFELSIRSLHNFLNLCRLRALDLSFPMA